MRRDFVSTRVTARMIASKGNKILMGFEERNDHWETPGGAIKAGETPLQALSRESMEEIGTRVKVLRNPVIFASKYNKGGFKCLLLFYYRCKLLGKPDLKNAGDDEFQELRFIEKKEFEKLLKAGKIMGWDAMFLRKAAIEMGVWR